MPELHNNENLFELLKVIVVKEDIQQIVVSKALEDYVEKLSKVINLDEYKYKSVHKNTLFVGMYRHHEYINCLSHQGRKWIYWHGNDCSFRHETRVNRIHSILKTPVVRHLYSSETAHYNLLKLGIDDDSLHHYAKNHKILDHNLDMDDNTISNIADPKSSSDVANKKYADSVLKNVPNPNEDLDAVNKEYVDNLLSALETRLKNLIT